MKSSDSIRAEAAAWIARLHGPQRSPELEAGLHQWLAENAEHARVFERMTGAWEDATNVATGHFPRVRTWLRPPSKVWARAAVVLFASGLAVLSSYLWWNGSRFTTAVGEQRIVSLEDGSRVSLNSASRLVVEYGKSVRHLRLEKGEAFFEVNPSPHRPFIVSAGGRQVTALGTSFSVRYEPDRLAVVLVDGKVAISALRATEEALNPASFTLSPGERLTFAKSGSPRRDAPAVETVTAWRRGEVVLEKMILADAIVEMNRYDKTRLVIDDASISELRVSGIYRTGDSAGFARAIGAVHGVQISEEGNQIHLRERRATTMP